MSTGTVCLKCRKYVLSGDQPWRCTCPTPLRSEDAKTPYGKPCTCDNALGSSRPCGVDAGERLGELWFCEKAWREVQAARP
jgi:hypothetical protein